MCLATGSRALPPAAPPPRASTPPSLASNNRESSLTVQQIVARQEEHYRKMKVLQGTVVWTDTAYSADQRPVSSRQTWIFFAREGEKSVTLALPADAAADYRRNQSRIDWKKVISANLILGDKVFTISEKNTSSPSVMETPYNPAIYDNNPLSAFHPRQMGDERIPLRELAAAIPTMVTRPTVTDVNIKGQALERIDFTNAKNPGELLYYVVDPAKAFIPVEIGRISNGRHQMVSQITIGKTRDGLWIPAKKIHTEYDTKGAITAQSTWYYDYLSCNESVAPRIFTPMFFGLGPDTQVKVARDPSEKAGKPAAPAEGSAGRVILPAGQIRRP